jgi:hypothetical protein
VHERKFSRVLLILRLAFCGDVSAERRIFSVCGFLPKAARGQTLCASFVFKLAACLSKPAAIFKIVFGLLPKRSAEHCSARSWLTFPRRAMLGAPNHIATEDSYVDFCRFRIIIAFMETIIFKAPVGTKARLKSINANISELLREETEKIIARQRNLSAYEKAKHLCGIFKGAPRNLSTSKDYLKQYAKKNNR